MADQGHLKILWQGVGAWNKWRDEHHEVWKPDLRRADLKEADLTEANLRGADLWMADLEGAKLCGAKLQDAHLYCVDLRRANLSGAFLEGADLNGADFTDADLSGAFLEGAYLEGAYLEKTKLCGVDLTRACLKGAQLIKTDLCDATLTGSYVYGVSVWDIKVNDGTKQQNLIIKDPDNPDQPVITVDDIEVAQFIYLLLNNQAIRKAIDTITSKAVLILGRFGGGGIDVLRKIAVALREKQYLPIIFDFERPRDKDYTETVQTLAGLSRFVIVDLSGPSVPHELYSTVPLFKLPFVPILERGLREYCMFKDLLDYPWMLEPIVEFSSQDELIGKLQEHIVDKAEARVAERRQRLNPTTLSPAAK